MKNKLLTLGLFTGIFLTACNNHSSEKKQNVTTSEPPEANVTSTTTAGAPTAANAPVINSAVGEDPEKVVQKYLMQQNRVIFLHSKTYVTQPEMAMAIPKTFAVWLRKPKKYRMIL